MTVIRQLDLVTRMLGNDLNMRVSRYVAETPLLRREKLRKDFADGHIQCLVAIRCLDEGVDTLCNCGMLWKENRNETRAPRAVWSTCVNPGYAKGANSSRITESIGSSASRLLAGCA